MSGLTEEEILAREEARLQRITDKNRKGPTAQPKKIFGGGLEAARLGQTPPLGTKQGQAQAQAKPTFASTTYSAARTNNPPPAKTSYAPPPAEVKTQVRPNYEVVEEHIPLPSRGAPVNQQRVVETAGPDRGLLKENEAAKREAERMSKTFGALYVDDDDVKVAQPVNTSSVRTTIQPKGPSTQSHAPSHSYDQTPSHTTSYAPSQTTSYIPPSHAPSHTTSQAPSHASSHTTSHAPSHAPSYTTSHAPSHAPSHTTSHPPVSQSHSLEKPTSAQHNTTFETLLLAEIIKARLSPSSVVADLRNRLRHFSGLEFKDEETGTYMSTTEGAPAVEEAINYLESLSSLGSFASLHMEEGLSLSARDFCVLVKDTLQPNETQEEARARLTKYGQFSGDIVQNVAFTSVAPSNLLLDWIIDDGQSGRPHRKALFHSGVRHIGIASGPHTVGRVICLLLASEYKPHGNSGYAPSQAASQTYAPSSTPSQSDFVYPAYKIEKLQSVDNGAANLLPISNLACDIHELKLALTNNGFVLEFQRIVTQNGKPRKEMQNFNLPYQVALETCSGKYHPQRNNGTLYVRLGKPVVGNEPIDYEITRYTIPADPNSTQSRVTINIDQQPDRLRFWPGEPYKYSNDFTVVLVGSNLEFRNTYSFEEGNTIKTVNGKQTVPLPVPPLPQQIEVRGHDVIIYPNSASLVVPDGDIPITLGD